MMSDSNPVVIVSYNNLNGGKKNQIAKAESITEVFHTQMTHLQVGKSSSFPISTDYLRVPTPFSNYETSLSLYSSEDSLEPLFYGRARSASGTDYTTISDKKKHDISSEVFSLERKDECASALQLSKPTSHITKTNDITKIFKKNLKRTVSAPIKTTQDLTVNNSEDRMTGKISPFVTRKQFVSPRIWRRSRTKDEDDKLPNSRFSLRRTLSNTLRAPFKEAAYEITFPTKYKKKPQKYRIVDGRTGRNDGISFEVIGKQGTYLRVKGAMLIPDKDTSDTYFNKDSTFVPLPDMWFPSFFAFESVSKPSYFIRLTENEELVIDKFDGTNDFKEEASFQLNRKLCATCLQVGVQTWGKQSTGEYCLGKVLFINNENVKVQFEDNKTEVYSKSDTTQFVPDLVPCTGDICVGTRVLAQWSSRHTLYPGVVDSIHKGNTYDVLFDDGDNCRVKAFQIRLVRTYSFIHDANNDSDISNSPHDSSSNHHLGSQRKLQMNNIDVKDMNYDQSSWGKASYNEIHVLNEHSQCNTNCKGSSAQEIPARTTAFPQWEIETYSQDSGYHGCDKGKLNFLDLKHQTNRDPRIKSNKDHPTISLTNSIPDRAIRFPIRKSCNKLSYPVRTNRVTFKDNINSHSLPEFRCESPNNNHINEGENKKQLIKSHSIPVDWRVTKQQEVDKELLLSNASMEIVEHVECDFNVYCDKSFVVLENEEESDTEFVNISLTSLNTIDLLSLHRKESPIATPQDDHINESKNKHSNDKSPRFRHTNVEKMDIIRERADSICQTSII